MNNEKAEKYGLTKEEAENIADVNPTYNLSQIPVGQSVEFKVLEDEPRMVSAKSIDEDTEVEKPTLTVEDVLTGVHYTIWLSSKSLRQEFYRVSTQSGGLKNKFVRIYAREYEHPKWGTVKAYGVQLFTPKEGA